MTVLGVNSVYHETSAALVQDGRVLASAEEERFNRRKHGATARVDNAHELPEQAITYCLGEGGTDAADLDAVCFSFDPILRERAGTLDPYAVEGDWGSAEGERRFLRSLAAVPDALSDLLGTPVASKMRWITHHLAHAASSYYPSPYQEAAILVVDGIGETATTLLAFGSGSRIEVLKTISFPNSLGFLWEKLSQLLGFTEYDACKVMGLAGFGDPEPYRARIESVLQCGDGSFTVNDRIVRFRQPSGATLSRHLGALPAKLGRSHEDLAAALQTRTNETIMELAAALHQQRPTDAVCVAGGVALNCVANSALKETGPFEKVFIPPSPHDGGTAVGAALYGYYQDGPPRSKTEERAEARHGPYLGPSFDEAEIDAALKRRRLDRSPTEQPEREAARLLAEGKIVAWFQGRMELGPRALGNRSLLADARDPNVRDKLNCKVKHRETFRPFAPSVLAEEAREWFDLGRDSQSHEYMLFACPAHERTHKELPAIVHVDGTARLQTVRKETNPRFHGLLTAFRDLAGPPVLLNTSFNDSEPIVCSPDDALETFESTDIDALVIGERVVEAKPSERTDEKSRVRG